MKNIVCFCLVVLLFSCDKEENESESQVVVYKAAGVIQSKLDEFRAALGTLNTTPGATGGRREINWEGVPDNLLNKPLEKNFFNVTEVGASPAQQRGLVYDNGAIEVSATAFAHINSQSAAEFSAFSGTKTFANVSALEWPIGFEVAGQSTPASVSAFGIVVSDVDVEGSLTLEFFADNKSLGTFSPPAREVGSSFSFLGVRFINSRITKVVVRHQGILLSGEKDISQGGTKDLVVFDDVIYSEPARR